VADAIPFPRSTRDVPAAAPPPERLLLDMNDLAVMLGLSLRHLRRMDCVGDIPGRVKVGRLVKFRAETIHEWVRAGLPDRETWAALQQRNGKR
jgi:predicted DNA-binding transcriptional regulator AlpA